MPADPRRVKDLFAAALDLPPADRAALLDRECGGDAELRRRLDVLLAARDRPHPALERPLPAPSDADGGVTRTAPHVGNGPTADHPGLLDAGTLIAGRYKLLQRIGEGGMGSVWMADQTDPVKRRVAVKLIRAERGQSKAILSRFEAERQAIALMDHPHIAKLLDAGTADDGSPFFVMELVKGVPLTEFCDAHRLSVPDRLKLFVQVCAAVQHAHQKGVIHRDLKPSNILVESHNGTPVPRVIDFGLAKATTGLQLTDHTLFTRFGTVMGTPLYMAPEQAAFNAVDVDTRADVYALGVILYELLTGTTPLTRETVKKAALDEMLKLIREQDAPTPSSRLSSSESKPSVAANRQTEPAKLGRFVKGELDWIVLKALSKERDRRYETANGFAKDVERFLAHEPVQAGPPTAGYRLKKFVQRNKGRVTAAGLVLVALVAGVVGTSVGLLEARRQAEFARENEGKANRAAEHEAEAKRAADEKRQEAERNLAFARKGNAILGSVFAGLDPNKIAESGRPLQDVLRENLAQAVRDLDGSAIGDPLEVAAMQNTLGWSLYVLGEYGPAAEVLGKAWGTRKARLGPDHADTLQSMTNLAVAYKHAGKFDTALTLLEEALRLRTAKLGPDHPDTLVSMSHLASGYNDAGKLEKALPLYEKTLALAEARHGPAHPPTAAYMSNLGLAYLSAGKPNRALPLLERALEIRKAKLGPEHPETHGALSNLAYGYMKAEKFDLALPMLEDALRQAKARLGPDHPDTLMSMGYLAKCYGKTQKYALALPLLEEELRLRTARLGPDHPALVVSLNDLALGYANVGKFDLALPMLEDALRQAKARLGPDHPATLAHMANLARLYREAGKYDRELLLAEEVLPLRKVKLGPDHPETLNSMADLGLAYLNNGKPDKALPLFEETLKLRQARLGPDHGDTLQSLNGLALAHKATGKPDLALPLFETAYERLRATRGPDHADTLSAMGNLARAYTNMGRHDKALPLLEEGLERMKATRGPDHPRTIQNMQFLAEGYGAARRYDEALRLFEETLKRMRANNIGPGHRGYDMCVANLVKGYQANRKADLAVPLLEEARDRATAKHGPDHPDTLRSAYNLAEGYRIARRPDQALPVYEDTLKRMQTTLGPDHPDTLRCLDGLASTLREKRQVDKSLPLYEDLLRRRERVLGRDHPDTVKTVADLGANYKEVGRAEQALPLYEEALRGTAHGPDHVKFNRMSGLAVLLWEMGRADRAVPLLESLLHAQKRKLGPDHPDTLGTAANLGVIYKDVGRVAEGLPLLEAAYRAADKHPSLRAFAPQLLDAYVKAGKADAAAKLADELRADARKSPTDLPRLAGGLVLYARWLMDRKEFAAAEPLLRECLAIREKLSPDAWTTFNTQSMLGEALLGQRKYADAEPPLLAGYEGVKKREKTVIAAAVRIPEALDRLVELYAAWGKPDEAAKWRAERAKYPFVAPPPRAVER